MPCLHGVPGWLKKQGRRWLARARLAVFAEFGDELAEFFRPPLSFSFGRAQSLFAFSRFAQAFAQNFRGVLTVFITDFDDLLAVKTETVCRLFKGSEIARRVRMHAERQTQKLALRFRLLGKDLLVDTDGQR